MTLFRLLLLIPAFLFGYVTYAQKAEPVKTGSTNTGVKVDPGVSNVKASGWKLEEDVVTGLENMSGEAVPMKQKSAFSGNSSTYDAQKQAILKGEQKAAEEMAGLPVFPAETNNAKLAASPNNTWDVLFTLPIVTQSWGAECDGDYHYVTYPYNSSNQFGKFTFNGF